MVSVPFRRFRSAGSTRDLNERPPFSYVDILLQKRIVFGERIRGRCTFHDLVSLFAPVSHASFDLLLLQQ
jgi:hypothetical protein